MGALELELLHRTSTRSLKDAIDALIEPFHRSANWQDGLPDLVRIARDLGVSSVRRCELPCDGLLIPRGRDGYEVLLNTDTSWQRQRFSFAHELGHAILHKHLPETRAIETRTVFMPLGGESEERICDLLAASLLMPRSTYRSCVQELPAVDFKGLKQLSQRFRVSIGAAGRRVKEVCSVADFAVAYFESVDSTQESHLVRCAVNFDESPIMARSEVEQSGEMPASRAINERARVKDWGWLRERTKRRRLFFDAAPVTSRAGLSVAVIRRSEREWV